jgi:S-DNA-T family DNA segregation ATPase FtsK/SpoIIIE
MAFFIPGIRALWQAARKEPETSSELVSREEEGVDASSPEGDAADPGPPPPTADPAPARRRGRSYPREAAALLLIASGLYCGLALASYEADPLRPHLHGDDWVGPVGAVCARAGVGLVGVVSWLVPLELILLSRPLLSDRRIRLSLTRLSGDVVVAVILAALTHIALPHVMAFGNMPLGGAVGDLFGEIARGLFSTVGSFLIGLTVVALILVERATFSFIELAQKLQHGVKSLRSRTGRGVGALGEAWATARSMDHQRRQDEAQRQEPIIASPEQADAIIAAFADDGSDELPSFPVARTHQDHRRERKARQQPPGLELNVADLAEQTAPTELPHGDDVVTPTPSVPLPKGVLFDAHEAPTPSPEEPVADPDGAIGLPVAPPRSRTTKETSTKDRKSVGPEIVDTSKAAKTKKSRLRRGKTENAFKLPTADLLDPPINDGHAHSPDKLKATARLLEKTLADYRVEGKVMQIHPGPTVTMFEVSPAPGTKVSKVAGLADDLALALSRKVRIVAPIPGKNRIGFEVPNEKRLPVNLRELLESQDFMQLDSPLPCVMGRDIIGRPFFADLAGMPHVIVAGATGAGKSVGLNVMLVSLLYRRTPDDLRLLMIDPKVVELAPFDRIPHLLFPVVTDMKQAANALKWTVDEMERRYQLFADAGTKNIDTYNRYVKRVANGEKPMPAGPKTVEAIAPDGTQLEIPACKDGSDATMPIKLPYIVVVVEEFADLMMTQGKEVEASVARLAQKARAAGIHVILATQRPSVDVITGMIKANFPTRVAYRVTQKVDSRTILDEQGAEHLLGRGDMLVKMNGTNDLRRVQCPFVSEDEVQRVTDHIRAQGEPEYDESIVLGRDDESGPVDPGDAESDPLYDQAVQIVADTRKCSTSWVQRKLGIGYNRAAKIVETMERLGLIGPPNGSKPREILISPL